ncbi:type I-E CRISPR-associated protein Cas5/CasD [Streptomyces sp. NPDC055105]|uniref:type I-E CRISPR-associated protein Cas5/CasD n=1 Tax=Streptomyces sp. NPDC055105 TaxID=3365719 RepID=UPI0037D44925
MTTPRHTLLARLTGPLQAWGVLSRFDRRDTHTHPTKSGFIGMLAAALGHDRADDVTHLTALRYGVRIDQPGTIVTDYHTVGSGTYPLRPRDLLTDPKRAAKAAPVTDHTTGNTFGPQAAHALTGWYGAPKGIAPEPKTGTLTAAKVERASILSTRHYLADAVFLAAVEHDDPTLLHQLADALEAPKRLLWLGRKSCPPTGTMALGIHPGTLEDNLTAAAPLTDPAAYHPTTTPPAEKAPKRLSAWIETSPHTTGAVRLNDQPVNYNKRQHAPRWETRTRITPTSQITWGELLA